MFRQLVINQNMGKRREEKRHRNRRNYDHHEQSDSNSDHNEETHRRHRHRPRYEKFPKETRVDLPPFHGRNDIDEFLDWEMKVEQIFASHHVEEERKVSLATLSF